MMLCLQLQLLAKFSRMTNEVRPPTKCNSQLILPEAKNYKLVKKSYRFPWVLNSRMQSEPLRVGQFFQVSPTVPLLCRVFHPDSKNGLFSALRRILNLHSVPDGKSVFLAFFGLMSLGSLFQSSDMKIQTKYIFRLQKFYPKTVASSLFFRKPRKKGQTLNPLCKLIACPKQEKRPFLESA